MIFALRSARPHVRPVKMFSNRPLIDVKCPFCSRRCEPKPPKCCGGHSARCRCIKIYKKMRWACPCTKIRWHKCAGTPAPNAKLVHTKEEFEAVEGKGVVFVKKTCEPRPFNLTPVTTYTYYEAGPAEACTWRPAVVIEGDAGVRARLRDMLTDEAYAHDLKPDSREKDMVHLVAVDLLQQDKPEALPTDIKTFVAVGERVKDYHIRRLMVGDQPTPLDWKFAAVSPSATREEVVKQLLPNREKGFVVFA